MLLAAIGRSTTAGLALVDVSAEATLRRVRALASVAARLALLRRVAVAEMLPEPELAA